MRKTKEEKEKTRIQLIDSATRVFSEKGFTATRLEDIAARAGLTRGAFYWHFKNKLDIYETVVQQISEGTVQSAKKHLMIGANPTSNIRSLVDFLIEDRIRKVYEVSILIRLQQEHQELSNLEVKLSDLITPLLESAINKGKEVGEFNNQLDVAFTAKSIFSFFWGLFFNYHNLYSQYSEDEFAKHIHTYIGKILK